MSGLVPLSLVEDDFYVFDESRRNLVGRRTRRTIGLGDKVTVQVAKVDTFKKQVDFRLVPEKRKPATARPPGARSFGNRPPPVRPEAKPSPASRPDNARRPGARPTLRSSSAQLPTAQRPLFKASSHRSFPKRRR
jgi:ribonuclease R